jgi:hypothetical protein
MAAALSRGEAVEFPFGSLQRVRHSRQQQQGRFLGKIRTIYRKPYTVVLEGNAVGEDLLRQGKEETVSPRVPVRLPPRPAPRPDRP